MKSLSPRPPKLLISAIAVLIVIGFVAFFTRDKEPEYNGKPLSHWVAVHGGTGQQPKPTKQQSEEAAEAIRAIGTNALPWLLAWLDYEPAWIDELLPVRYSGTECSLDARAAIIALGPLAVSAIPELHRIVRRTTNAPQAGAIALIALCRMGPAAVPAITNILATMPYAEDHWGMPYILETLGTNAIAALPILLQHLANTNEAIATTGAACLAHLHLEADQSVPALTEALGDPRPGIRKIAAEGLGNFGPLARSALPALTNALSDPDELVRSNAKAAIHELNSRAQD